MKHKNFLIALILSFGATGLSQAQESGPVKACVFLHANYSETDRRDIFRDVITDALTVELKAAHFEVVSEKDWQEAQKRAGIQDRDLVHGPVAVGLAREAGAQLAITGLLRIEDAELLFSVKAYAVDTGELVASVVKTGSAGLQVYSLINDAAAELVPLLREHLPAAAAPPAAVPSGPAAVAPAAAEAAKDTVQVTLLSGDEGAEVSLAGGPLLGRIEGGRLGFEARQGSLLLLDLKRPGYREGRKEIQLKDKDVQVRLPALIPVRTRALELEITSFQFLGLGAAYRHYLVPDLFYGRAESYLYIQRPMDMKNAVPVIHDDLELQAGVDLFAFRRLPMRIGVAAGLGCILTKIMRGGTGIFTDIYFNPLDVWLEYQFPRWSIYLKTEVKYFLGIGTNILGVGYTEVYGPMQSLGVIWRL